MAEGRFQYINTKIACLVTLKFLKSILISPEVALTEILVRGISFDSEGNLFGNFNYPTTLKEMVVYL
jgi:hypothetical protein